MSRIEIIGMHPVDAVEPCHLVEAIAVDEQGCLVITVMVKYFWEGRVA